MLDAFSEGGDGGESAVPEATGLFDNFVSSERGVNFEYQVGFLTCPDQSSRVQIIGVIEIDQQALVAVPDSAWHRTRRLRSLPEDALYKPVRVEVRCAGSLDRTVPEEHTIRIWLGFIKPELVDLVVYGVESEEGDVLFPVDGFGFAQLPYAQGLVAVAQDHFTFLSAESAAQGEQEKALAQDMETRMSRLERGMTDLLAGFKEFQKGSTQAAPLPPRSVMDARAKAAPPAPPPAGATGLDPMVVQQAMAAGVSISALNEIGNAMKLQATKAAAMKAEDVPPVLSSDEDEHDVHLGGGQGQQDPLSLAIVQLSKIVGEMRKEKKQRKDKGLEAILDRAESGSAKDSIGYSRSKAAALRSLQSLLQSDPKLIYQALEKNMQADWEMGGQCLPGAQISRISARGWLEHRSRISSFPGTIRPAWLCAGIWDALMMGRVEEARARAALATACFDQQSCDRGGWLLAAELTLEPPPPYASFSSHTAPDPWETQHTRLVDDRWSELFLSKLKEIAEYQEKRSKLTSTTRPKKEEPPKGDKKGKGSGKAGKKQKDSEETSQAAPQ